MKIKEWIVENLAFLLTLVFAAVAFYATFQNLVYRMDQVEARVEKIEGYVISKDVFEAWQNGVEGRLELLLRNFGLEYKAE